MIRSSYYRAASDRKTLPETGLFKFHEIMFLLLLVETPAAAEINRNDVTEKIALIVLSNIAALQTPFYGIPVANRDEPASCLRSFAKRVHKSPAFVMPVTAAFDYLKQYCSVANAVFWHPGCKSGRACALTRTHVNLCFSISNQPHQLKIIYNS
ncbi:hypothetical protein FW774_18485 [Pedobacter sp. BS3]|uniref:hypothetical protein n=1 Tax=Pedobacter sp. BS3 TaxID=2567937 RepID=UPI0011EF403F|nr:hypothetical protein [Pedobacter sp. BS3]TZF81537.1 hypothetical protein FW774_18485 [Pedobacter sp. BS3]